MKALSPSSSSHTGVTRFRVTPYTLPASSARPLSTTAASSSLSLPSRDPSTVFFPTTLPTRQAYLHPKTAKPLTAFQWKVYDLTYQVSRPHSKRIVTAHPAVELVRRELTRPSAVLHLSLPLPSDPPRKDDHLRRVGRQARHLPSRSRDCSVQEPFLSSGAVSPGGRGRRVDGRLHGRVSPVRLPIFRPRLPLPHNCSQT